MYCYFLGHGANRHSRVHTHRNRRIQRKPGLPVFLESSVTNGDVINAHGQGRKNVEPHSVGLDTLADSRSGVEGRDRSARYYCSRRVLHSP